MSVTGQRKVTCVLMLAASFCTTASVVAQPMLLPPGPPVAPSGRFGVRTEINSLPYVIAAPGSYYLSGDLFMPGPGPGITIFASNVTIDLMGFGLFGIGGGPGDDAIVSPFGAINVTVHNGFVNGWGGAGISLLDDSRVSNVTVAFNGAAGVSVGPHSIVRDVISVVNFGDGIVLSFNSKLTNGVTAFNGGNGVTAFFGAHISDSMSSFNTGSGFSTGPGCVLIGSVALQNGASGFDLVDSNRATDCVAAFNGFSFGGDGFTLGPAGNILGGCAAYNNAMNGFSAPLIPVPPPGNSVHDCIAVFNGFGFGAGDGFSGFKAVIQCTADVNVSNGILTFMGGHVLRNTIEGNHVSFNGLAGIDTSIAAPPGNFVAANRSHLNGLVPGYLFPVGIDTTAAVVIGPGVFPGAVLMGNVEY
jgi:hypothetical protein